MPYTLRRIPDFTIEMHQQLLITTLASKRDGVMLFALDAGNPYRMPVAVVDGLLRYLTEGIMPGSFLQAVLANDLHEAVLRADPSSLDTLHDLIKFINAELPAPCWGSRAKLEQWCASEQDREIAGQWVLEVIDNG